MTEQPQQHPDDLLLITREELDRCCSQMSAAGYKVSANYVEASVLSRSRPSPALKGCPACQNTDCNYCDLSERPLPDLEKALAEAAAQAREDFAKIALERLDYMPHAKNDGEIETAVYVHDVRQMLKSLRSSSTQERDGVTNEGEQSGLVPQSLGAIPRRAPSMSELVELKLLCRDAKYALSNVFSGIQTINLGEGFENIGDDFDSTRVAIDAIYVFCQRSLKRMDEKRGKQ